MQEYTITMPDVDCTIEPTLAGYIDQQRLEKLLERTFRRKIVVYVSDTELSLV